MSRGLVVYINGYGVSTADLREYASFPKIKAILAELDLSDSYPSVAAAASEDDADPDEWEILLNGFFDGDEEVLRCAIFNADDVFEYFGSEAFCAWYLPAMMPWERANPKNMLSATVGLWERVTKICDIEFNDFASLCKRFDACWEDN